MLDSTTWHRHWYRMYTWIVQTGISASRSETKQGEVSWGGVEQGEAKDQWIEFNAAVRCNSRNRNCNIHFCVFKFLFKVRLKPWRFFKTQVRSTHFILQQYLNNCFVYWFVNWWLIVIVFRLKSLFSSQVAINVLKYDLTVIEPLVSQLVLYCL